MAELIQLINIVGIIFEERMPPFYNQINAVFVSVMKSMYP